jgi:phosphonate transport system substrate-binding protein
MLSVVPLAACGSGSQSASDTAAAKTLTIGAIPDQDPQKLQRLYGSVATRLSDLLGVPVTYKPVTDYTAAVSLFRTGDLQLVWFGGLTGVQARLQTPGATPLVQRDIDDSFHSLFIANRSANLRPVQDVAGLTELKGTRFTYGSQSSTSGYLMPAYFLDQAGVDPQKGFAGQPGLSGSHDKTIDLVTSGSFQAGAVNEQVWKTRLAAKTIDTTKVQVLFRTPEYHDYHWLLGPTAAQQFGQDFPAKVSKAFEGLDPKNPADHQVLELFGAQKFVPTSAANYTQIEDIGRQLGLVTSQ